MRVLALTPVGLSGFLKVLGTFHSKDTLAGFTNIMIIHTHSANHPFCDLKTESCLLDNFLPVIMYHKMVLGCTDPQAISGHFQYPALPISDHPLGSPIIKSLL